MRALILIIFAILVAGTCKAQTLDIKPTKGGMTLSFNFEEDIISVSNPKVTRFSLTWPDGSGMRVNLNNQNKRLFKRVVKRMREQPYTWLNTRIKFYRYELH